MPLPETAHPATVADIGIQTITITGAVSIYVTFDRSTYFDYSSYNTSSGAPVGSGNMQLSIKDKLNNQISGSPFIKDQLSGRTVLVTGDTVTLTLTNASGTSYGYKVIRASDIKPPLGVASPSGLDEVRNDGGVYSPSPQVLLSEEVEIMWLSDACVGQSYTYTIRCQDGTGPYTFFGVAPPGLTLSTSGILSGTPTTQGEFQFTVHVIDSAGGTGIRNYKLVVMAMPTIICGAPTYTTIESLENNYFSKNSARWILSEYETNVDLLNSAKFFTRLDSGSTWTASLQFPVDVGVVGRRWFVTERNFDTTRSVISVVVWDNDGTLNNTNYTQYPTFCNFDLDTGNWGSPYGPGSGRPTSIGLNIGFANNYARELDGHGWLLRRKSDSVLVLFYKTYTYDVSNVLDTTDIRFAVYHPLSDTWTNDTLVRSSGTGTGSVTNDILEVASATDGSLHLLVRYAASSGDETDGVYQTVYYRINTSFVVGSPATLPGASSTMDKVSSFIVDDAGGKMYIAGLSSGNAVLLTGTSLSAPIWTAEVINTIGDGTYVTGINNPPQGVQLAKTNDGDFVIFLVGSADQQTSNRKALWVSRKQSSIWSKWRRIYNSYRINPLVTDPLEINALLVANSFGGNNWGIELIGTDVTTQNNYLLELIYPFNSFSAVQALTLVPDPYKSKNNLLHII